MKRFCTLMGLAACLSSCALQPPKQVALTSTFDPQEVAWFNKPGTGSVTGQALLRTNGGEPRTCAGLSVYIEPKSTYATERISEIYGNADRGFNPIIAQQTKFNSNDPAYLATRKTATCDAQGNFTFDNLPAGQYFVIAPVVWEVGYSRQGGVLMQGVPLGTGEAKHIIMTP